MVKPEDIKLSRVGFSGGQLYVSDHDVRPTAPNGTLWYVSSVDAGGKVHLWSINGWGRIHEENASVRNLTPYIRKAVS